VARTETGAFLDGKTLKALGFIKSAVLRLSIIIDLLLRLSRAGRVKYHPKLIDVIQVVANVLGAVDPTAPGAECGRRRVRGPSVLRP
jgi:hypothetical protein